MYSLTTRRQVGGRDLSAGLTKEKERWWPGSLNNGFAEGLPDLNLEFPASPSIPPSF